MPNILFSNMSMLQSSHLLLCLSDRFIQHEGEILYLPFQTLVVVSESPEGPLQTQHLHPHS